MASKGQAAAGPVFSDRMLRTTTASCAGARAVAVACTTRVGTRKSQEDRLVVSEDFHGHTVLAVFDGTVGDYASDFCQKHFLDHLAASKSFQQLCEAMRADEVREVPAAVPAAVAPLAGHALKEALAATDAALLAACAPRFSDARILTPTPRVHDVTGMLPPCTGDQSPFAVVLPPPCPPHVRCPVEANSPSRAPEAQTHTHAHIRPSGHERRLSPARTSDDDCSAAAA